LTTKIHMLADALGRPLRFIVTAGQVGDATQAEALLEGQSGAAVLADKAYDSNALRETITAMKAEAVIPSNRTRKVIIPHDAEAYRRYRHHGQSRLTQIECRSKGNPQRPAPS
jgi:transposase